MIRRAPARAGALLRPVGLGLAVTVAVETPWSALVVCNLRLSPHVPWAIPVGIGYVGLAMAFLNGGGWPESTSAARRRDFRASRLVPSEFTCALFAGFAAFAALWLVYAASGYLSVAPTQGAEANLPPMVLLGMIVIGAAVTAVAEEGGLRGFAQAPLERVIGPVLAIAATSLLFVMIHLSHGVSALARNGPFYLVAGCVYGLLAYLTQSILVGLLLHFLGDILTLGLRTSLVHLGTPHGAATRACLVISALFVASGSAAAFLRLARLTSAKRSRLGAGDLEAPA